MGREVAIKLEGAEDLMAELQTMRKTVADRICRDSLKPGLAILAREVRKTIPGAQRHRLRKLVATRSYISKKGKVVGKVFIKPSKTDTVKWKGRTIGFEVVAGFLEFGTKTISPRAFMRGARISKGDEALAAVGAQIEKRIHAEWEKGRKGMSVWQ